jgi:hypothetical protein
MSYFFHFSSCIIGPSIEFSEFKKFINLENEYSSIPFVKVLQFVGKKLVLFIVLSLVYLIGENYFPTNDIYLEKFGNYNYFYKIIYIYIAGNAFRSKYYSGWCLSHTAMAFSGITYKKVVNKETKEVEELFTKAENFVYEGVEFEINPKKKMTVSKN